MPILISRTGPVRKTAPTLASVVTLAVFLTIGLTMVLVLGLVYHFSETYASREAGLRLQQLSWQMRDALNRVMSTAARDVSMLASLDQVRGAHTPGSARVVLDNLQNTFPDYAWIGIAGLDGKVFAASRGLLENADVSQRPWFKQGQMGLRAVDYHPAVLLGKLLPAQTDPWRFVDMAIPLQQMDGTARGVISIHLSWDWTRRVARGLLTPALREYGAEILVVRNDGTVLLGPNELEEKKLDTASVRLALQGQTGFMAEVWPDGRRYLVGYSLTGEAGNAASLGWTVLVRQPESVAMAAWDTLEHNLVGASLMLGLVLATLAAYAARRMARPLMVLGRSLEQRSAGVAELIEEIGGFHEAQVLSRSLHNMLAAEEEHRSALQRMNEELESKVEQRTADLHAMAMQDILTGLPNRRALMAALPKAIDSADRSGRPCAVLFLDLDGFKGVNDTYGHEEGDELLKQFGRRIVDAVRKTDMVVRLAGDEFVVVLELLSLPSTVQEVAEAMQPKLRAPFQLQTTTITLSASIGGAVHMPGEPETLDRLLGRADHAMYVAKRKGKDCVAIDGGVRDFV